MKKINIILLFILLSIYTYSQIADAKYIFRSRFFYESIELFENGSFSYFWRTEFITSKVKGNWQLRNDSILVLDSSPQRSKLIVFESQENTEENIFKVRGIDNYPMTYHLFLITECNDTISFIDQYDETIANGKFSSFYIVDTKGLYSPLYTIKGLRVNFFSIIFEPKRVFDNEHWLIISDYEIKPIGLDGKYVTYNLKKTDN